MNNLCADMPLPTQRPRPKCLKKKRQCGTNSSSTLVFDSATENKRTGKPIVGTGTPCGALSTLEFEDILSFCSIFQTQENLATLGAFLDETFCQNVSRVFANSIVEVELRLGQYPRLYLLDRDIPSRDSCGILLDKSYHKEMQVTSSTTLSELCCSNSRSTYHPMTGSAIIPSTLHCLTRFPIVGDAIDKVTVRLGRRRPNMACQRVAEYLQQAIISREQSIVVAGSTRSGKTTLLREILHSFLSQHMYETRVVQVENKVVGVVDVTGELSFLTNSSNYEHIQIENPRSALDTIGRSVCEFGIKFLLIDNIGMVFGDDSWDEAIKCLVGKLKITVVCSVSLPESIKKFEAKEILSSFSMCIGSLIVLDRASSLSQYDFFPLSGRDCRRKTNATKRVYKNGMRTKQKKGRRHKKECFPRLRMID